MPSRILLIDDEPELLRALTVRLTAAGFTCVAASNGKEAFEKLAEQRPDLIILDLLMPEMSGYEVCRRLKEDERTSSIPVIVLTAVPGRTVKQTAQWLGVSSVLHKPFDSAELVSTVRDLLKLPLAGGSNHG